MSITKIKSDRIITPDGLFDGYICLEDGTIKEITKNDTDCDLYYDLTGLYISPGFIDMHTHGAGGHSFLNTSPEDILEGCHYHLRHGTTTILPTVSASPFPEMRNSAEYIAYAIKSGKAKINILGAHLEGPYLSASQCGAQCPDFITDPIEEDYKALISEFGDYIARWTYAPEKDTDGNFCRYLSDHGILPSAGHTDAKYEDMVLAIENGCQLITHLYSCTSTVTRKMGFRSLGVIESAFLRDDLFVEIIADGRHLPAELVQMIVKIKGMDKVALITDSLHIAGTDIKEGIMGGTPFIVEDGVCKLKDRSAFAGSVATADRLIEFMVKEAGFGITDAVYMLTAVPAKILRVNKGILTPGKDADICVFGEDFTVKSVFVAGNEVLHN